MEIVCDSSVALAWGLPDERSPEAEAVLVQVTAGSTIWVPALWWYELANALVAAQRRRRISEADSAGLWDLYGRLPVAIDLNLDAARAARFQSLAIGHGLSAYDAAYIELAERKGLALATLDRRLRAVAGASGVALFGDGN
jgi:predicted nucleic acid-binding protein